MRSGFRKLKNKTATPPVQLAPASRYTRGHSFDLGAGRGDRESMMRQYGMSGTVFSIVTLLSESTATPVWRMYKKQPVDGRRRYTTGDIGSDQRIEIVTHAALTVWNRPNDFLTGFEFRESVQQHEELTGETFWVLNSEAGFPTAMWHVRPDRMEPVTDNNGQLTGWIYTGPEGSQVPLKRNEVIQEKRPDPLDPYRGSGPVASIMPNIQQQRYATEYQRNLFFNGADPGGIITVPNNLEEREFDQLIDRWRESHRGVARAGHIGVLEAGTTWTPSGHTNKDLEYGELRLANRDELREAWRIHKAMLGTSDDVNRANAQTAEEVFVAWQVLPRLNRRRDTLNNKFLPLFGTTSQGVEFDYDDPSPVNAETAATELLTKAQAAVALMQAGFDGHAVLETVGLPDMDLAEVTQAAMPAPAVPAPVAIPAAREQIAISAGSNAAAKAFEQLSPDFPPEALAWAHHAQWVGPAEVPLDHIEPQLKWMNGADPDHVQEFVDKIKNGKKLKPVILVKVPGEDKLQLADGHHRYLASCEMNKPIRAFIATVSTGHGGWETMHGQQYPSHAMDNKNIHSGQYIRVDGKNNQPGKTPDKEMVALLQRVLSDGYVPVQTAGRS